MNRKYPLFRIGVLDADIQQWYEAEQCWNCEPEVLRKIQIRKNTSVKNRRIKRL